MIEIHGLPAEQCAFVKKIAISQKDSQYILLATVAYVRNPRDGHYKMRPIDMNRMERRIYGYKEAEYPSDELDQALLEALRATFQDVESHTSIQMFDNQQQENKKFVQGRKKGTIRINIMRRDWNCGIINVDKEAGFSMMVSVYSFTEKDIEQLANKVCEVCVSNDAYTKIKNQLLSFHTLEEIVL